MEFKSVGSRIKSKRQLLNMTQSELAEKVDVSVDYISKLERGVRVPKLQCFTNILNELGLSADEALSDIINTNYFDRTSDYIERIGEFPKEEQDKILDMLVSSIERKA